MLVWFIDLDGWEEIFLKMIRNDSMFLINLNLVCIINFIDFLFDEIDEILFIKL